MDFSSLLSKEIERKRTLAGEKRANKRAKPEDAMRPEGPQESPESRQEQEIQGHQYTPEETALMASVSDEQLETQLKHLDEACDPGTSKLDKIRRVEVVVRLRKKNETYRLQLEKEDAVDKTIQLEDIANGARDKLHTQVRAYIKQLVKEWEHEVDLKAAAGARLDDGVDEETAAVESARLRDTKKDLVSLLYKLRTDRLSLTVLTSLCTVIYYLQIHDYRRANESYMKLSIGNVAWPIGVKGVGIHERSAALKITGENKNTAANIMLDDKTRRWITAVKRLVSFAERKWPSTPSSS